MSDTTPPWRNSFIVACFVASTGTTFGQQFTATIVPVTYNGYHVSCFGLKDGSATVQVTGGEPPYTYDWSMGGNTATVTELAPGYIKVKVYDAGSNAVEAEYTLMEPAPMKLVLTPFKYPSGNNISCHECFNGSIDLEVSGGVAPYSYIWDDDITTPDRSGLGAMKYTVQVVDVNACKEESSVKLEQPEKATWGMVGNANTDPATHYIGTSDNTDVVFKANGQESLRLKANGDISLLGSSNEAGPLYRDVDGVLRLGDGDDWPTLDPAPCTDLRPHRYWKTWGNNFTGICPEEVPKLGTLNNMPLRLITNDQIRMIISNTGKVGIGTTPTNSPDYQLFVEGGIVCRDVLVKLGAWPDYVFQPNYGLMPLSELRSYLNRNQHLPGIPSAKELAAKDGVEIGEIQRRMLQVVEEQALYILELEERYGELEKRLVTLEQKQH